jgi:hypothetical protein
MKEYKVVLLSGDTLLEAGLVSPGEIQKAIQDAAKKGWQLFQIATGGAVLRSMGLGGVSETMVSWVYLVFEKLNHAERKSC